jgi:hypothetical protein
MAGELYIMFTLRHSSPFTTKMTTTEYTPLQLSRTTAQAFAFRLDSIVHTYTPCLLVPGYCARMVRSPPVIMTVGSRARRDISVTLLLRVLFNQHSLEVQVSCHRDCFIDKPLVNRPCYRNQATGKNFPSGFCNFEIPLIFL